MKGLFYVFYYNEKKFKLQRSNFNLVRPFDGNLYNCRTCQVKYQKGNSPCVAKGSKLEVFDSPLQI